MVKDLAQFDLLFLSYGQITIIVTVLEKSTKNLQFIGDNLQTASPIEQNPSPYVLEFQVATLDV